MNTEDFKECLFATGIHTGELIASYNFSNQVGSVILNDLYDTGDCYFNDGVNNVFYTSRLNLGILQSGGPFTSQFTGYFSGLQYASVQIEETSLDFNVLLDFSFNDCSPVFSRVLLSNVTGSSLSSGLVFGINQANKFFLEYGTGSNKRIHTSQLGVSQNNVINFGVNGSSFYLRKYNFLDRVVSTESFDLENFSSSNKLIFAKSFGTYSGFSGKFNQVFLSLNDSYGLNENCYECLFCTGVANTTITGAEQFLSIEDPLSYYNYSISGTGITGYQNVTVYDGFTNTYVSSASGVTGSFLLGTFVTGDVVTGSGFFETSSSEVLIHDERRSTYIDLIEINFTNDLESGDLLDVYDYHDRNTNTNLKTTTFDSDVAIFSNGMLLISGLDYSISGQLLSDSFDISDEIRINRIDKPIEYLLYSGLYDVYKKPTGDGSEYYPAQSQFLESGDGNVTITGFGGLFYSGFSLGLHDLFMNGQKIYSGIDYRTGSYGGEGSVIIYASNFNDADLLITTGISGLLVSVDYQTESVLAFCPRQDAALSNTVTFLSGAVYSWPLSGESEEVWLNGIKLIEDIDYGLVRPCSSYAYSFNINDLPYVFCNDGDVFFNIN